MEVSRIGKLKITLPSGVNVLFDKDNLNVTVKGGKGELVKKVGDMVDINVGNNCATVSVKNGSKDPKFKKFHGLYSALLKNMVKGVSDGFQKKLEFEGVGYKGTTIASDSIEFDFGFSHKIIFIVPDGISFSFLSKDGKKTNEGTILLLEGIDNVLLGEVAAKIKALKPVEPYKGKGIRYSGEFVRRKAGKTTANKK